MKNLYIYRYDNEIKMIHSEAWEVWSAAWNKFLEDEDDLKELMADYGYEEEEELFEAFCDDPDLLEGYGIEIEGWERDKDWEEFQRKF